MACGNTQAPALSNGHYAPLSWPLSFQPLSVKFCLDKQHCFPSYCISFCRALILQGTAIIKMVALEVSWV